MRRGAAILLMLMFAGVACSGGRLGPDPEVATLMLHFPGNDTVFVDIASGVVTSGPIAIFNTVDFTAQFFAADGTPDGRVTDARFRLDVTPANTGIVTFTRGGSFDGTINKVTNGTTNIAFALVRIAEGTNEFNRSVAIEVN